MPGPRRTQIINAKEAVFEEKKFEEMEIVFLMDRFGYCRTVDVPTFERNGTPPSPKTDILSNV